MSRGVWYMLLSTFLFSLMNVCIKFVPNIPAVEIVFFRSVVSFVISLFILKSAGENIWGKNKLFLILRGVAGAMALILYFRMIQDIPLASAYSILFLAPIFTTILSIFIVKEKVKPIQWLFFVLSFIGVLLIKGFDDRVPTFHLLLGIGASLCSGLAFNFIRKLNTSEHPVVIIFYFPLVSLPITGLISAFNWVMPQGIREWLILLAIGILTQIAQYFMTKAYQSEEISKVASLRYTGIIYAIMFGYVFFDERYTWLAFVGMGVTILGVLLNLFYKHFSLKNPQGIFRGRLMN